MKRLLFIAAGLIALVLVIAKWPKPKIAAAPEQPSIHAEEFARHLFSVPRYTWRTHAISYGHVHFLGSSYAARTSREIAQATEAARSDALQFLELQDTFPIEVFFVDTRLQMQELVGRPIGGMVQSGERSALLVYSATYTPFLVHELTHLFTHYNWGPPRNGRWVSEGMAALATGACQGHSIGALVKGLHDDGLLRGWNVLVQQFDGLDEVSANLQAASMIEFLRARGGIAMIRELWMSSGWDAVEQRLGTSQAMLEREWLNAVRQSSDVARLDLARLHAAGCL